MSAPHFSDASSLATDAISPIQDVEVSLTARPVDLNDEGDTAVQTFAAEAGLKDTGEPLAGAAAPRPSQEVTSLFECIPSPKVVPGEDLEEDEEECWTPRGPPTYPTQGTKSTVAKPTKPAQ